MAKKSASKKQDDKELVLKIPKDFEQKLRKAALEIPEVIERIEESKKISPEIWFLRFTI